MIEINVVRDKQRHIQSFTVSGHSGFAEQGSDIVCAAISALAYTGVGALKDMAGIDSYIEKDGYMECLVPKNVPDKKRQEVNIILETIVLGFKQVELSYRKYVSVLDKEV
ncbi:ribosomal-processing cysteine protease Prp [Herbivorax sp. ANBcel31]|uniref:ribosomal-processing cysteine protease Prp n=1 Tax=Herbivorax sp. ANBcel31 TaxID=3069754 RepID=UPI0027B6AA0A|nr:ribosomal-processing cysteine protease Prp [Herbivorax sp. ANBcel31]MDQ2087299.1 ribosomal-processing cysteine protease Prp [Herbivorax sp. ANBcel31]